MSQNEKIILHEEDAETKAIIESWFNQASEVKSLSKAFDFAKHVINDYSHDYGTICHAISAAAIATAWGANNEPGACGGITGFQAGFVMWGFIKHWTYCGNKTGLKIIDFDKMLYPQYETTFQKTISNDVWQALQDEAKNRLEGLDSPYASDRVIDHWRSIVNGVVPFGYAVEGE